MNSKHLIVFGTRPEAIKMAPLVLEFRKHSDLDVKVCVTAQHREMLDQVLDFFEIRPDYDLDLMKPNQTLYSITADIIMELKPILESYRPEYVYVHGDTTTSMAASIASFYSGAKVCHVEAGLRTFNKLSPFPEEINRQLTGRIADFHFAPTTVSEQNLLNENISSSSIIVTGNTVIDALINSSERVKDLDNDEINQLKSILDPNRRLILVTGHRRENHGEGFIRICQALKEISSNYPEVQIIYPVHLNPNVKKPVYDILSEITNIHLINPLAYPAFVYLMNQAYIIITDSGGVQEEAPSLGKPVLVMRDTTERPEAVEAGTVILVGTNKDRIVSEVANLLDNPNLYNRMSALHNPYGDGKACMRIVNFIKNLKKIKSMHAKVVTVGLGYIGLPTSALIANNGIPVHGVDISKYVVDTINAGKIHIVEPDLDQAVAKAVNEGLLKADIKPVQADTYLIVVPTPFKGDYQPDISYVKSATESILPLLKDGDLYIIESTSPVGTTEKMMELIFSNRPELEGQIYLAYCPERVLPGNVMHELIYNDRVIGGVNEESTQKAMEFYRLFVKGNLHPTNARTAEMCKLTENASRDSQIAFANELSLICDKAEINVWELIKLANMHPRVNILQPGCGVGGHCIAVDPYFITSAFPMESRMITQARQTNNYKPFWCAEKIKSARLEFELKNGRQPVIALMGLAFKPNIDDLRESPAIHIVERVLQDSGDADMYIVEPNVHEHKVFKLTNFEHAVAKADIIAFLVAHNEFKTLNILPEKVVLDFCGIFQS